MELFEAIALTACDATMLLILTHSIIKNFKTSLLHKFIYIITVSVLTGASSMLINNDIAFHILSTLICYAGFLFYLRKNQKKDFSSNTILFFAIIILILIVQLSCAVTINFIISDFNDSFKNGIVSQILGILILLIISKALPISVIYTLIKEKNILFNAIIITVFFIYYSITILWHIDISNVLEVTFEIIIAILLTITINTILLKEGLISKANQEKLKIYETYLPIVDDIIEEFKKRQHDYDNHIQTIISISNNKDIQNYVNEIHKDNVWDELLKINNKIIQAFLFSKYTAAKEMGINIIFHIDNFNLKTNYANYELVEIYGILIDNAVEAVGSSENKKDIEITLSKKDDMNVLIVKNPFGFVSSSQINSFFQKGYSTKEGSNRGIGLPKLKEIIKTKKGSIMFYYDAPCSSVVAEVNHY